MNNVFTAKLLQNLRNKKGDKGFTLIELLVVVIIIGVLAAVALPNLLGQVGKARESEAKNIVGALNRAQQSRYVDKSSFAGNTTVTPTAPTGVKQQGQMEGNNYISLLEVPTTAAKYYAFGVPSVGLQVATGNYDRRANDGSYPDGIKNHNLDDGTRDYVGAIHYDQDTKDFQTVLCRSMSRATGFNLSAPADALKAITHDGATNFSTNGIIPANNTFDDAPKLGCLTTVGDIAETEEAR